MRRIVPALVAALFSVVTFSAYAVGAGTEGNPPPPQKHAKKKKKAKAPSVQQGAPAAQGRCSGRSATAAGGGAVTSPTPKGAGRADNQ